MIERDEDGIVIPDPGRPLWVNDEAKEQRWNNCVGIAKLLTQDVGLHTDTAVLASYLFNSAIPTEPLSTDEDIAEGFLDRTRLFAELVSRGLIRRDREGQFADTPNAPMRIRPAPPHSPGTPAFSRYTYEQIKSIPSPTDKTREVIGDFESTAERYREQSSPASPGSAYPPYMAERHKQHERWVARELAGVPEEGSSKVPHGVASLLGVDHPITKKLAGGEMPTVEERTAIREAAVAARGDNPLEALYTAGGSASGKTTVLGNNPELRPTNALQVDPDAIKEHIPEYVALRAKRDPYAAAAVHLESGDLARRLAHEGIDLGLNVVMDGTGNGEPGEFMEQIDLTRNAGYKVHLFYVTIPTKEAERRAAMRADEEGRLVPLPTVRETHAKVSAIYQDEILPNLALFARVDIFDGSREIATAIGGGGLQVFDGSEAAYAEFLAKRHEISEAKHDHEVLAEAKSSAKYQPHEWIIELPFGPSDFIGPLPTYADGDYEPVGDSGLSPSEEAPPDEPTV